MRFAASLLLAATTAAALAAPAAAQQGPCVFLAPELPGPAGLLPSRRTGAQCRAGAERPHPVGAGAARPARDAVRRWQFRRNLRHGDSVRAEHTIARWGGGDQLALLRRRRSRRSSSRWVAPTAIRGTATAAAGPAPARTAIRRAATSSRPAARHGPRRPTARDVPAAPAPARPATPAPACSSASSSARTASGAPQWRRESPELFWWER